MSKIATTSREKSILRKVQVSWDRCFNKWYNNPTKFENYFETIKTEVKAQPPGQPEKASMLINLKKKIGILESERDLSSMAPDDFLHIMNFIERCSLIATTPGEKKFIEKARNIHADKFSKWHTALKQKDDEVSTKTESEPESSFSLSDRDKRIMAVHHLDVNKWMKRKEGL